jgi:thiol-disulfide isomerase/thioredoxin
LNKKHWLIDLSLIFIIIVMGVFVTIELNRTFDFWRQRSNASPTEDSVESQLLSTTSDSTQDDGVVNIFRYDDPTLQLMDLDGAPILLSDFRGKPVLVNFWATWCPPCLEEMPLIDAYAIRHEKELVVLAINVGENEDVVHEFVSKYDFSFNILLDPTNSAAKKFFVYGYPTTMFFDEAGNIQSTHIGELNEDLLLNYLVKIGIGK